MLLDLLKGSEKSVRNITTDNVFTHLSLACDLGNKELTFLGTIKKSKTELPPPPRPLRFSW